MKVFGPSARRCLAPALVAALAAGCAVEPAAPLARVPAPGRPAMLRAHRGKADDAEAGRRLFAAAGCAGCHTLRDLPGATGVVGPNLTNVVLRPTIAGGAVPTSPENLAGFLLDPAAFKPGTPMPRVGLTPEEARAIALFLYRLPGEPRR